MVADSIRRLRLARGLSQKKLADRSGLGKSYLSNVEQGHVNLTLASMEALAQGLQCSLVDILLVPPLSPCEPYTSGNTTGSQVPWCGISTSDGREADREVMRTKGH
jgi:transcriptional regulator with XRE-family HTH domain